MHVSIKVFYLGGLFLMPSFRTEEFLELLKFCRERGVASVVDVVIPQNVQKLKDMASLLPFIDYFLPNEDEARAITGCLQPLDQLRALLSGGVGTVVVTCGKNGAWAGRGRKCWRAGCFPIQSVDPSGSGDAFAGGIITGIVRHWELPKTLAHASALGASAVRAIGTTTGVFTAPEAEAFLATHELPIEQIDL
jgi:sugar/nucleoside kinase (ribokinase family)